MSYNPECERLYVSRDFIPGQSPALKKSYLSRLRSLASPSSTGRLHVNLLSQPQVARVLSIYPKEEPRELFIDALGELQLEPILFAHVKNPRVVTRPRRGIGDRSYVILPLDREGERRVKSDTQKILAHFGINGSFYQQVEPHVTLLHVDGDEGYAEYLARSAGGSMADRGEPVAFTFPVADYPGSSR